MPRVKQRVSRHTSLNRGRKIRARVQLWNEKGEPLLSLYTDDKHSKRRTTMDGVSLRSASTVVWYFFSFLYMCVLGESSSFDEQQ